jgi:hypothetical protein
VVYKKSILFDVVSMGIKAFMPLFPEETQSQSNILSLKKIQNILCSEMFGILRQL